LLGLPGKGYLIWLVIATLWFAVFSKSFCVALDAQWVARVFWLLVSCEIAYEHFVNLNLHLFSLDCFEMISGH